VISRKVALQLTTAGLIGGIALTSFAWGAEPLGEQSQVSFQAPDGDAQFDASRAALAHNNVHFEHLVVWQGMTGTVGEFEIYGQRVGVDGGRRGPLIRVSDMGPDGNAAFGAFDPSVVYNPAANEYLVVWRGDDDTGPLVDGEFEIFAQRLSVAGVEVGGDFRISDMGPDGNTAHSASTPAIAYNASSGEYLVAWSGDDDTGPLVNDEFEVFTQRISSTGAEIGTDTRVSQMGADGDSSLGAFDPAVAYDAKADGYLVTWRGDDDTAPLVDDEFEIFAQRLSTTGAEVGTDTRISTMGPDGNAAFGAGAPAVEYNAADGEYLVAWSGDDDTTPLVDDEFEVFAQRVGAAGMPLGARARVSQMGPDGAGTYAAAVPTLSYNTKANEYLVAWHGDDDTAPLVDDEFEIFVQRLDATAGAIGRNTRLSRMGPDGSTAYGALEPDVSYHQGADRYLVAWHGDDDTAPLVDDELEVYVRTVEGSTGPPGVANCAPAPVIRPSGGGGAPVLSPAQLKINQRIGAAAVRRANAIQQWLDAGIVGTDLCGGSLAPEDLDSGIGYEVDVLRPSPPAAAPRPLVIPAAAGNTAARFSVTIEQMRINQRIYAAAVRRANALKVRLSELTGGDVKDGTLNRDRLRRDLTITALTPAPATSPASTTKVADAGTGAATFELRARQLKINQRIAVAAVKRTNALRARIGTGLTGDHFVDGSISAVDLAP
jgi:hypothetical protein